MIVQPTQMQPEQAYPGAYPPGLWALTAVTGDLAAAASPLLREALARAGAGPAVLKDPILRERDRAPRLAHHDDWHLSLSHSGGELAAAAARQIAVGIDLEWHRPRDFARLSRLLHWSATSAGTFYPRWTLAEALYKAGAGPSGACFEAAGHAPPESGDQLPSTLELALRGRTWNIRWNHRLALADRLNTTICVVWSVLP